LADWIPTARFGGQMVKEQFGANDEEKASAVEADHDF
jgi:hypothetical protein